MTQPPEIQEARPFEPGQQVQVEAVGSRPWARRALSKMLTSVTFLTVGAVLGVAAINGPLKYDTQGRALADIHGEGIRATIAATVQDIHWVDLPQSPFLEAGWTEHGEYSNAYLMERWWAAGVPTEDFHELLRLGRASAPTIMGTRDVAMEAVLMNNAQQANREMAERWPQAAQRLADPQWLSAHTYIETDDKTAELIQDIEGAIIQEAAIDEVNGNDDYLEVYSQEEAKKLMENAMAETGLRSLRLSSPWARDPQVMGNVAYKLVQSNNQLRERTGWDGAVLGLGGRVDMVFAQGGLDFAGATTVPHKRQAGSSNLAVYSTFQALPHEWFHSLDYVLAREVVVWGHGHPLSNTLQAMEKNWGPDFVLHRHGALMDVMDQARVRLQEIAPDWKKARADKHTHSNDPYWADDAEMMAFAFTGQIRKWKETSIMEPSMDEAERQAPLFDAIFEQAKSLGLTERSKPTIDTTSWKEGPTSPRTSHRP